MPDLAELSIWPTLVGMAVCALIIGVAGVELTRRAEQLSRATGLGDALIGGILLGMITSLSGTVLSISSAAAGNATLSVTNAVGGIAAQTVFLALGDFAYRRANLEHAGASAVVVFQAALLILLLVLPLAAQAFAPIDVLGLHPVSLLIPALYIYGVVLARNVKKNPRWRIVPGTVENEAGQQDDARIVAPVRFAIFLVALSAMVATAGWSLMMLAGQLRALTGLQDDIIGAVLTATITSLPELVIMLTAIRRGSLELAIGGIIGGNTFDVLFLPLSDIAFREGSIYHAAEGASDFWILVAIAMTAALLMGLISRQKKGLAGIGYESWMLIFIYSAAIAAVASN